MAYEKAIEGLVGVATLGVTLKMLENVMDDSHHHVERSSTNVNPMDSHHSHPKHKQLDKMPMW